MERAERAMESNVAKAVAAKPLRRMLLKPAEVCELTGLGKSMVYGLIATGELPSVRIGRCVRVRADRLRQWFEGRESQGGESSRIPPKGG